MENTKISLELVPVAIVHNAAVKFYKIQKGVAKLKNRLPSDSELEIALEYVLTKLKETTGVK